MRHVHIVGVAVFRRQTYAIKLVRTHSIDCSVRMDIRTGVWRI